MTREVYPNFRNNLGECQGVAENCKTCSEGPRPYGKLRKPDQDGLARVRDCGDKVGKGRQSRTGGLSAQKRNNRRSPAASSGNTLKPGNEETMLGLVAVEDKHGAQVRPAVNAFEKQQAQHLASKKPADNRPFLARMSIDGLPYAVCAYRQDQEREFVFRMAVAYGMIAGLDGES